MEIGFHKPVAVVILSREIPLLVACNIPHEKVGESISGTHRRIAGIESQNSLDVGAVFLVLLGERGVNPKRKRVGAMDFGHVVAISVNGIGVVPREVTRIGR